MKAFPWVIIVHCLFLALPDLQAHFPWLNTSTDGKAAYFFGESLAEKTYKLPPTIAKAKVWLISDEGQSIPLDMKNVSSEKFLGLVSSEEVPPESTLASKVTYGLFGTSRLDYYTMHLGGKLPKTRKDNLLGDLKWNLQAGVVDTEDGIEVQVLWKGKPLSGTEIHLYGSDGEENGTGDLDSRGIIAFSSKQIVSGVNGIMFGHRVPGDSGVFNDQKYDSSSHYFTLTFHDPNSTAKKSSTLLKPLPSTLTSFGAARLGEYLYVFSGHQGTTHGFSIEGISNHFRRIRFNDPSAKWEELSMHEGAQSTALVSDGEYLYRVGGLTFNNKADEDTDFKSTNHFARYDVNSDSWTNLTPLPTGRSSLDAAVLGRSIFVAGGWNLQGASSNDAKWHKDILRYDLDNPAQEWKSLKGPGYITRAASVAAYRNRLYVFGGIQTSSISRKVSIFDPETNEWEAGPDLPSDSSAAGFATSSFSTGGSLYITGDSGIVYKLHENEEAWKSVGRLMYPRMFHRLVPADAKRLLAIGGTSMRAGRMASIESFSVDRESNAPTAIQWSNRIDGNVTGNQSVVLSGSRLYAFGGQTQTNPENNPQPDFSDDAYLFNLQRQTVETLPKLPFATEGAKLVVSAQTSEHRQILLFGGKRYAQSAARPSNSILAYDPDSKQWRTLENELPNLTNDLTVVAKQDAVWFFGTQPTGMTHPVLHWWVDETEITPIPDSTPPNPRRWFAGATDADAYYIVGGLDNNEQAPSSIDIFDFNTRTWRSATGPKTTRLSPDLVIANKKLYLFGGHSPESSEASTNKTLEVYDIASDQWTNFAHPLPEINASMRLFSFNDRLLFYGIDPEKQGVVNFILLDPEPLASPGTVAAMDFTSTSNNNDEVVNNTKLLMRRDTNRDGQLTKGELGSRLATLIDEGDANSDGVLSYAELKSVMELRFHALDE